MSKILVTGGCGFIGSHLIERLLQCGHEIRVIDNLSPQIHSGGMIIPKKLLKACEFYRGDIRDTETWSRKFDDIDIVIHLAAETGVGQSMYEIDRYTSVNVYGTSVMLEHLMKNPGNVKKLILASSRAVYGEGDCRCESCRSRTRPHKRKTKDLKKQKWDLRCSKCNSLVSPMPTKENSLLDPISIYAVSKLTQEQLMTVTANTLGIESVILRYQNVYGPRQALSNPYTGILSIFSTRIQNNKPIEIYEDGLMCRDFVHIFDVVKATELAIKTEGLFGEVYNVGSGEKTDITTVAKLLCQAYNIEVPLIHTNFFRVGDIRNCYSDNTKINSGLGFYPDISLVEGLKTLSQWVLSQPKPKDKSQKAVSDLIANKVFEI